MGSILHLHPRASVSLVKEKKCLYVPSCNMSKRQPHSGHVGHTFLPSRTVLTIDFLSIWAESSESISKSTDLLNLYITSNQG